MIFYTAMTAAEMALRGKLPAHFAYMACHFSPYGTGLSNLPEALPEGSLLILNDRIPIFGHDPLAILGDLEPFFGTISGILLDFQRENCEETAEVVRVLSEKLPCPAAVTPAYGNCGKGPVFLPPCPPDLPMEAWLAPWEGRELWQEAAFSSWEFQVTEAGTQVQEVGQAPKGGRFDENLCCQYTVAPEEKGLRFTLFDTPESLTKKLQKAASLGVTTAVGLYQQLGTAF